MYLYESGYSGPIHTGCILALRNLYAVKFAAFLRGIFVPCTQYLKGFPYSIWEHVVNTGISLYRPFNAISMNISSSLLGQPSRPYARHSDHTYALNSFDFLVLVIILTVDTVVPTRSTAELSRSATSARRKFSFPSNGLLFSQKLIFLRLVRNPPIVTPIGACDSINLSTSGITEPIIWIDPSTTMMISASVYSCAW